MTPRPRRLGRRTAVVASGVAVGVVSFSGVALAYWIATDGTYGARAVAAALPQGGKPTAAISGNTVTVSFPQAVTSPESGGKPLTSYAIKRYSSPSGGDGVTVACEPTISGSTVTCTDSSVSGGTWYYSETPQLGTWTGAESALSDAVTSAVPATLGMSGLPTSGVASSTASMGPVTVQLLDSAGKPVAAPAGGTTVSLASSSAGGTFATSTASDVQSVFVPAGVSSTSFTYGDTKAGTSTITASANGLSGASASTTITPAAANKLGFGQQPTTAATNGVITPAPTVTVQDAFGNTVTSGSASISMALTNSTGGSASFVNTSTTTATAVNGVATFANLKIGTAGTGYTLTASGSSDSTTLTAAASSSFDIGDALAWSTNTGGSYVAGAPLGGAGGVAVTVTNGGKAVGAGVPVTVAISSGTGTAGATLSGTRTVLTDANGIAKFTNLSIDKVTSGSAKYSLVASVGSISSGNSTGFTVSAAAPAQLGFTAQPAAVTAGTAFGVTVQQYDQFGNTASAGSVSLAVTPNTGTPGTSFASGTTTATPSATGAATFSNLVINRAGSGYTLTATSGTLTAAVSSSFNVNPAALSSVAFGQQPSAAPAGAPLTPAPTVVGQDQYGNRVPNASVTMVVATGPTGAVLSGTTTTTTDANGVATFNNLSLNKTGTNYTLRASSGTPAANSNAFTITSAAPSKLIVTTTPSPTTASNAASMAVTVQLQDSLGNAASSPTDTPLTLSSNTAGTAVFSPNQNGTGGAVVLPANSTGTTFYYGDTKAGSPTITVGANGLTSFSQAVSISAASAAKVGFSTAPVTGTASTSATLGPITVQLQDSFGNTTNAAAATTVNLASNSTGTRLFSTKSGGASTSTVSILAGASSADFYYGDNKAGTPTITATATNLNSATQTETITPAAVSSLTFGQQPTPTTAGAPITPAPTVIARDTFSNLVPGASVTMSINTGVTGNVLSGTPTAVTNASGVATFADLSLNKVGAYTLKATSGSGTVNSGSFNVAVAAPAQLVVTSTTTTATASTTGNLPITVQMQDAFGNVATSSSATPLSLSSNTTGTPVFASQSGGSNASISIAPGANSVTFYYGDTKAGTSTVNITAGSMTGTSRSVSITPAAAASLTFGQQPTNVVAGQAISPAPTVTARDNFGNLASGASVSMALGTNAAGGTLSGTLTAVTDGNGVATFGNLTVAKAASGYSLIATSGSAGATVTATSDSFAVTPAAASKLAFVQQPVDTKSGTAMTPAPSVIVLDAYGNTVTSSTATIVMTTNKSTLSGTTSATPTNGIATFNGLVITGTNNGVVLTATSGTMTVSSNNKGFSVTP